MITLRHTTLGRAPLDALSARRTDFYLKTHNTHNRQISMPPGEFEPAIPASEPPQAHALSPHGHWDRLMKHLLASEVMLLCGRHVKQPACPGLGSPSALDTFLCVTPACWFVCFSLKKVDFVGRDSPVSTTTRYGLDGPGSNPGVGEIFRTCPDRPWGPPNLLYNDYLVLSWGKVAVAWS